MQGISPSASNLGARAKPSSTLLNRHALLQRVSKSSGRCVQFSCGPSCGYRSSTGTLAAGSGAFAVGGRRPPIRLATRTAAFASARLDRRRPPELVSTDSVGRLPTIAVSMSNPFLWPRPAAGVPLALVINERNVYNIVRLRRNRDQCHDAPVDPAPALHPIPTAAGSMRPAERVALAMSLCDARGAQLNDAQAAGPGAALGEWATDGRLRADSKH